MFTKNGAVRSEYGSGEAWADDRSVQKVIEIISKHNKNAEKLMPDRDICTVTSSEIILRTRIPLFASTTELIASLKPYGEVYAQDNHWFMKIKRRHFPSLGLIGAVLVLAAAVLAHVSFNYSSYKKSIPYSIKI